MKTDEVPEVKKQSATRRNRPEPHTGNHAKNSSSAIVWRDINYDLIRVPLVDINWSKTSKCNTN